MKKILLTLMMLIGVNLVLSAQDTEQTATPTITCTAVPWNYFCEDEEDYTVIYQINACQINIEVEDPGATIYYRIIFDIYDDYSTEWMPYDDIIMFTEEGHYEVEAYAQAEGKLPSESIRIHFYVYPQLASRVVNIDGIYYRITDEYEAYVSKKYPERYYESSYVEASYSGDIVIPNQIEYDGETYSVTGVDAGTFRECDVTSVELPNTIQQIEENAFAYSTLSQIYIPASVTELSSSAFYGCNELTSIEVDPDNAYYDSRNDCNAVILSRLNSLIIGCQNTIIPNTVTRIAVAAFSECANLTSLVIPNSVTDIGSSAFAYCTGLTSVELPNAITRIGDAVFYGCTSLASIDIPNSVKSIGRSTFYNCESLTDVVIPNSVKSIDGWAFYGCTGLISVTLPNAITYLSSDVFCACHNLASIEIPSSVTSIGQSAFYECRSLTSVEIPNSVTSIGYVSFARCTALKNVTIGHSVNNVATSSFKGCTDLESISIHAVTPPSANVQFNYDETYLYGQVKLFVPNESLEAYSAHKEWGKFEHLIPFLGAGPGDVNGDGKLSISDVTGIINELLSSDELPAYFDVNGDGKVSITDVTALIDMLLKAD